MNEMPDPATDDLLLKYADLERLQLEKPEHFKELARKYNIDDDLEEARKMHRARHQFAGKIICAARRKWEHQKEERFIFKETFPEYFERTTGRRPSKEGYSCAKAYAAYALAPEGAPRRIRESDYDENVLEAVKWASRIVSAVDDDLDHVAVAEAASILKRRGKVATKELRALFDRLAEDPKTGKMNLLNEAQASELNTPPIDYASGMELASRIAKAGHCSVMAGALEKIAASTPDLQEARALAIHAAKTLAGLKSNLDENGQRRYSDEAIAAWKTPEGPAQVVSVESLEADFVAAKRQYQEIEKQLSEAGIDPPQLPLMPQPAIPTYTPAPPGQAISMKRWKAAELQVLELLRKRGWQVVDVTGQKAGCDFKGLTEAGEEVFVEVKSISRSNQPFDLTDDEMLLAHEKGAAYRLALVRQTDTHLQVAFICDPKNNLKFRRKSRVVLWECSEYEFRPDLYPLE